VPLAARLGRTGPTAPEIPSWLGRVAPVPKPRPLRAKSLSCAVVPVAESAEETWRAERQRELEEARAAAEVEGLKMAQAKVEMLIERYLDGIERVQAKARTAGRPGGAEVVDLALLVAAEVIGRELTVDRELLAQRVDETLAAVQADGGVVVKLGAADVAYIRRRRPDLAAAVTLVEEPGLGPGGCHIETAKAAIDLTVAARLEAVRAAIAGIVAEAGVAAPTESDDE
jgi:flagellar assembly protein FliH